jgi:GxxExxY protein
MYSLDDTTIVELKAIRALTDGMELQAQKYLDLTGLRTAYLVNFPLQPDREVEVRKIEVKSSEGTP